MIRAQKTKVAYYQLSSVPLQLSYRKTLLPPAPNTFMAETNVFTSIEDIKNWFNVAIAPLQASLSSFQLCEKCVGIDVNFNDEYVRVLCSRQRQIIKDDIRMWNHALARETNLFQNESIGRWKDLDDIREHFTCEEEVLKKLGSGRVRRRQNSGRMRRKRYRK